MSRASRSRNSRGVSERAVVPSGAGWGKTIDDALATKCTVPVSLEPFEGEGRTGTVAQQSFEPCTVTARDRAFSDQAGPARTPARPPTASLCNRDRRYRILRPKPASQESLHKNPWESPNANQPRRPLV